jgi:hypothetical protein
VKADRPGSSRFGGPRHLAVTTQEQIGGAELSHPTAIAPKSVERRSTAANWGGLDIG